jgi:ABC-2 type transport system ATP-binding protein
MTAAVSAKGLTKHYGKSKAVDDVSFEIESGRIVGLIGANGSGKTTTLKAILGLIPAEGDLKVLGLDPRAQRDALMQDVSFIADVAILPRWIKVRDLIKFMEGVHPKFDRIKAESYIANTKIHAHMKVKELSKGMVVQLHLALIMAVNAKLLVLDEPTLGLDILYRKQFYRSLLEDYFDANKTIIITTHQIEEIEHVVSDLIFINGGRIVLQETMDSMAKRFVEVDVSAEHLAAAKALQPIDQRNVLGNTIFLYDGVAEETLATLGQIRIPALSDIFVASLKGAAI